MLFGGWTVEQYVGGFILAELEILYFLDFPFRHVMVIEVVPDHRVFLEVSCVANVMASIWLGAHVHDKSIQLVLNVSVIVVGQDVFQIQNKFEI